MDNVYIYVSDKKNDSNIFKYIAAPSLDNIYENHVIGTVEAKTLNNAIIISTAKYINTLKNNTKLNIYVQTNFGFKFMSNNKKWVNRQSGDILRDILNKKYITVEYINYSDNKDSNIKNILKDILNGYSTSDNESIIKNNNIWNINTSEINRPECEIELYIRGMAKTDNEDKIGAYMALLKFKNYEKEFYNNYKQTTANRMIIQGIIDSVKNLKKTCKIHLYTHTKIGMNTYINTHKSVNKDLLEELYILLCNKNHTVIENISDVMQNELKIRLNKYIKSNQF